MKAFICLMILVSVQGFAQDQNSKDDEKCGVGIAYRPGGSTLLESRYGFGTELEILLRDCAVQEKLPKQDGNFIIRSYSELGGKETLVYQVETFQDPRRPMHSNCTLTRTQSHSPSLPMDSFESHVELSCSKPICTEEDSYLCKKN